MKKLEVKDFLDYTYLSALKASGKRSKLAFVSAKARLEENDYTHNLYVLENDTLRRHLELGSDSRFIWEDEENILVFTAKTEEDKRLQKSRKTVVYRYNTTNGEFHHAYTLTIPVGTVKPLEDGRLLLSANLSPSDHVLFDDKERDAYIKDQEAGTFFEEIETVPFYFNGAGFTQGKNSQVFLYDPKTDEYTHIFDKDTNASFVYFDEKAQDLYLLHAVDTGVPVFYDDLSRYNLKNNKLETLYDDKKLSISRVFVLNDTVYALANDMSRHGINENNDFYKIEGKTATKVATYGLSGGNSIGSDARLGGTQSATVYENDFYFVGTFKDRTRLYKFDGTTYSMIFDARGSLDGFDIVDGVFYGIGLYNNGLQEVYTVGLSDNTVTKVTDFNTAVLENKYTAIPETFEFENDGQVLDGWVLLPQDYDANKKYPAILDIHGGPKTIYSDVFYHEMQAWTNLGYIVFFTNPRGGDSYGDDFANIRGKYGTIDYDDLMVFTDEVIKRYSVDTDRLGVTGGSYGGFMTNWIVSHTDRFKAAATQRSISNWISFYGTSDIGTYFAPDQTDSNPFTSVEKMWEQSPLKHADNIKTPLLFIHSEEDYRCPIEQAMQLFTRVKMNGVDTRLIWVRKENHDLSRSGRPQARVKRLEEITAWMEKYLK